MREIIPVADRLLVVSAVLKKILTKFGIQYSNFRDSDLIYCKQSHQLLILRVVQTLKKLMNVWIVDAAEQVTGLFNPFPSDKFFTLPN